MYTHTGYTVCAEVLKTLFLPQRNGFKPVIYIFCCSVSVGNVSLHFQTLIVPLIVIIQWKFWMHKDSMLHTEVGSHHHWVHLKLYEETEKNICIYLC